MASFRWRKTKSGELRCQAEVRIKGHRPRRKTFSKMGPAKRWAEQTENRLKAGFGLIQDESDRITAGEAIDRFLEDRLPLRGTAKGRAIAAAQLRWWRDQVGDLSLANLTRYEIDRARRHLLERVQKQTTNRYLAALSNVLKAAVEWGWLRENPIRGMERMQEPPGRLVFLEGDELRDLLEACFSEAREPEAGERLFLLVLAGVTTGARETELMTLRWQDLDLERGRAILGTTKNRDRRALHLHGQLLDALRERAKIPHFSGYVFATRRSRAAPGRPPSFPRRLWDRARSAANLTSFRFHDLRHTFASHAAMSGATLAELQQLLGHRTLAMVKRYTHLLDDHTTEVSRRVGERLLGSHSKESSS